MNSDTRAFAYEGVTGDHREIAVVYFGKRASFPHKKFLGNDPCRMLKREAPEDYLIRVFGPETPFEDTYIIRKPRPTKRDPNQIILASPDINLVFYDRGYVRLEGRVGDDERITNYGFRKMWYKGFTSTPPDDIRAELNPFEGIIINPNEHDEDNDLKASMTEAFSLDKRS